MRLVKRCKFTYLPSVPRIQESIGFVSQSRRTNELSSESALSLLDDVRVLAIEQYGAGPFGSMHLADLGAEIIKIEDRNAGGDVARQVSPYATNDGDSLFFQSFNRNKRSISLDMKNPAGRKVFEQLVARSDVVYSNLRGDVPARLRIRYEDLEALNPRIVCVSLSAFGTEGPRSHQPGYDYILQALTGWMDLTGEPRRTTDKIGPFPRRLLRGPNWRNSDSRRCARGSTHRCRDGF